MSNFRSVCLLLSLASLQITQAVVGFNLSPAAVSNSYPGQITLQVGGLTNTEPVIVQKFFDLNTNGVIDGNDWLVQQFNLRDGQAGMVIGGVTNVNVPGDLDGTGGAIRAALNFRTGDFLQLVVGSYAFKLSSPTGRFTPITNWFAVTNLPFPQQLTGNVVSNATAVTVSNAIVLLLEPSGPGNSGPGNPIGGVVADNTGHYSIRLPPGSYVPVVVSRNYVYNFPESPVLTLGPGQTLATNLSLTRATANISGVVRDANNASIRLPGVWLFAFSEDGMIGFTHADDNGSFNLRVSAGSWAIDALYGVLGLHGYMGWYGCRRIPGFTRGVSQTGGGNSRDLQ